MRVYFAPDTSDHPNWGCRVMGRWFPAALARAGAPAPWRLGSQWFYRRHRALSELGTLADFHRYAGEVRAGRILPKLAAKLQACDLVYLNGENFIRPGTHKGRKLLFLAYLVKTLFNKPCILSNHSVDLAEPELEEIVREIYPQLDEVHFREQTSVDQGARFVTAGRWRLIPDVAWAVPAKPIRDWGETLFRTCKVRAGRGAAAGFDPARPYITVCGSSMFGQVKHGGRGIVDAFITLCQRLNKEVCAVVLAAPDEPDLKLMRKVQAVLGLPLLGLDLPVRQAINIIGNATVHVGGRWHPGIFAATGGTPWVAFSANNHKVHSLVQQMGLDAPVFDVLQLGNHLDEIIALVQAHAAAGTELRRKIRDRSHELAAQVDGNMDFVRRQTGNVSCQKALSQTGNL